MKTVLHDRQPSLVQWVSQATGINSFGVKVQLRGNDLHILCEGSESPQLWPTLSDLLLALQYTDLNALTSAEQASIYQIFVYGRKKGQKQPNWCHRVDLNQLDQHLEEAYQALIEEETNQRNVHDTEVPVEDRTAETSLKFRADGQFTTDGNQLRKCPPAAAARTSRSRKFNTQKRSVDSQKAKVGGALIISNESLARQGNPEAIARYLSETLSTLGVAVQVKVKKQKPTVNSQNEENRLWIFCQASYSPDPSLIAEPIAQKLRHIKLSGYQDAIITCQVVGEIRPDWLLRVDLTPPEVMLKDWARWGDVQAIVRMLNEALSEFKINVHASNQESTLHVFCTPAADPLGISPAPDKAICLEKIVPQLEAIAPQGLIAAAIYGQKTTDTQPTWIDWLDLPAAEHPAFAASATELANSGDEPAISFLLERLLNPDLETRLKTGGIRVLLLRKGNILHIMCDAPVCPQRKRVAKEITEFVRQLKIPEITGICIYGRRAGNKKPFWNYGVNFEHRQRLVPKAVPEFATTSVYIHDLLPAQLSEPDLQLDFTTEEVQSFITRITQDWGAKTRKLLVGTQLFLENDQSAQQTANEKGLQVAFIWGLLGLLLTLQTDWVLGQIIARTVQRATSVATVSSKPSSPSQKNTGEREKQPAKVGDSIFNASVFTPVEDTSGSAQNTRKEKGTATAILLAARSHTPSFNARQLDEQLALYKQRLAKTGNPPDVLIIGSSRALRGIDPAALSQALAAQGHTNIDVFNFGINGATAKVVDFVISQVLEPVQLPRLIIWADGSRAFNSGREDITYNAIAASPGYKQVSEKAGLSNNSADVAESPQTKAEKQQGSSLPSVDEWFNQVFARASATYQQRDQLKNLLNHQFKSLPLFSNRTEGKPQSELSEEEAYLQAVDFDGFLPLSIRFNPATYYQKHAKVTGSYDHDYKSFQLAGEQDEATEAVLQLTQSRKIPLVFVNMPLTKDYLDPVRTKYDQQFQQYMLSLANNSNFIYRDISQLWPQANDYFSDPSHLNRYGAYEVSKKLANDPMIPWPTK